MTQIRKIRRVKAKKYPDKPGCFATINYNIKSVICFNCKYRRKCIRQGRLDTAQRLKERLL